MDQSINELMNQRIHAIINKLKKKKILICDLSMMGYNIKFPAQNADRLKTFGIKLGSDAT